MRAQSIARMRRRRAAAGSFAATAALAAAILPASAQGEVVTPHAVTPHAVTPHVVTPPPAPSPTPEATPAPSPAPSSDPAPAPVADPASAPAVASPASQSPAPTAKRAPQRPVGDDDGSDQQTGGDPPHQPWGPPDPFGVHLPWITVPLGDFGPPLFGPEADLPTPLDEPKTWPIGGDLGWQMNVFNFELEQALPGPHKAVTDPTNTAPAPGSTIPSDPSPTFPGDGTDPDSDGGGAMFDSGSGSDGGGGGGGLPDIDDPGPAAD